MAQTYVGYPQWNADLEAFWSAIPHRIRHMSGRPAFVYVNPQGQGTLQDIIDGVYDAEWQYIIDITPAGAILAPLAEANGTWVTYHGTASKVAEALAHIDALDAGKHRICGSFYIRSGSQAYINAAAPYVDIACPSYYDTTGRISAATVASGALNHAAGAGLPLILAQTGTVRADKVAWATDLTSRVGGATVIYFNHTDPVGWDFSTNWPY